jgi:hypothetical protein
VVQKEEQREQGERKEQLAQSKAEEEASLPLFVTQYQREWGRDVQDLIGLQRSHQSDCLQQHLSECSKDKQENFASHDLPYQFALQKMLIESLLAKTESTENIPLLIDMQKSFFRHCTTSKGKDSEVLFGAVKLQKHF